MIIDMMTCPYCKQEISSKVYCKRCGHVWYRATDTDPVECPSCKSAYWNREPKMKRRKRIPKTVHPEEIAKEEDVMMCCGVRLTEADLEMGKYTCIAKVNAIKTTIDIDYIEKTVDELYAFYYGNRIREAREWVR